MSRTQQASTRTDGEGVKRLPHHAIGVPLARRGGSGAGRAKSPTIWASECYAVPGLTRDLDPLRASCEAPGQARGGVGYGASVSATVAL